MTTHTFNVKELDNANLCRYRYRDLLDRKYISGNTRSWMSQIIVLLAIFAIFTAGCNLLGSGPPDNYLISSIFQEDMFSNIEIENKIKCPSLTPRTQAIGIDEAWLVSFSYDVLDDKGEVWRHEPALIKLFVKMDGNWLKGYVDLGITSDDCP